MFPEETLAAFPPHRAPEEECYYLLMPFGRKGQPGTGGAEEKPERRVRGVVVGGPVEKPSADVEIVSIVTPPPPRLLFLLQRFTHTQESTGKKRALRLPISLSLCAKVSAVSPFQFDICCSDQSESSCSSCAVMLMCCDSTRKPAFSLPRKSKHSCARAHISQHQTAIESSLKAEAAIGDSYGAKQGI